MLVLTREDLSLKAGGVTAWWGEVPWRKDVGPAFFLSWEDIVLVDPKVQWPAPFNPSGLEGWGQGSFHMTWVKGMAKVVHLAGVPTPDVGPLLDLERGEVPKARVRGTSRCLHLGPSRRVYLGEGVKGVVEAAVEYKLGDLDARVLDPPWAPGRPLALLYLPTTRKDVLKVVATAHPHRDAK
jgi:hypothetical protein